MLCFFSNSNCGYSAADIQKWIFQEPQTFQIISGIIRNLICTQARLFPIHSQFALTEIHIESKYLSWSFHKAFRSHLGRLDRTEEWKCRVMDNVGKFSIFEIWYQIMEFYHCKLLRKEPGNSSNDLTTSTGLRYWQRGKMLKGLHISAPVSNCLHDHCWFLKDLRNLDSKSQEMRTSAWVASLAKLHFWLPYKVTLLNWNLIRNYLNSFYKLKRKPTEI